MLRGNSLEGGESQEQVAQRGCECPILGGVKGQVGWGPGQPDNLIKLPHKRTLYVPPL